MSRKTDIEGLNSTQKKYIASKGGIGIHSENFGVITYPEEVEANAVHADLQTITNKDDYDDLNASLNSDSKLHGWPC